MGNLPKEWLMVQHCDIADVNPGLPSKRDLSDEQEVSFVPMNVVQALTGKYDLSQVRKLGEVKKGYTPIIDGDVIFAKITPCMENGKIAVLTGLKNGIGFGSTEFHVSRPYVGIDARYLFYYFVQSRFREDAKRHMSGSAGQLRVPSEYFKSCMLPITISKEQRKVVEKIEELFSDLDNAIENLKKAQEQLKVYRQAVLTYIFNTLRNEGSVDSIFDIIDYRGRTPPYSDRGVIHLRTSNIRNGKISLVGIKYVADDVYDKYMTRGIPVQGDVLMTTEAPLGEAALIPDYKFSIAQRIVLLRPKEKMADKFILYQIMSPLFQKKLQQAKTGTTVAGISSRNFKKVSFKKYSYDKQVRIVRMIETRLSECEYLEDSVEESKQKSEILRQSIFKQAFEGKLTEQWRKEHKDLISGENSVELLLKKVKAEKEILWIKLKGKK